MAITAVSLPGQVAASKAADPPLWLITVIFWAAFAVASVASTIIDPHLFERQDPDSFLHIVQVRDLLAGQAWFDLVQHRMDPPEGSLLHWSRLIDAPIAGLVLIGNLTGLGERFATIAWPVLLLLAMMGGAAAIGAMLGRAAAVWTLGLSLFAIDPLIVFLPGDIDHHNAQIAVTIATVACAVRIGSRPLFGFLAACGSALTLAIGLEMLPHVAVIGMFIALRWAITGRDPLATAAYGMTFAVLPALLYFLIGSPAASMACDSLSWVYAFPAEVAGFGLAGLALLTGSPGRAQRLGGLVVLGGLTAGVFLFLGPGCITGPYGSLSEEVKQVFLRTVTEAQPFPYFAAREPVGAFASLMPLLAAMIAAAYQLRKAEGEQRIAWTLPAVLLVMASALSFYQIRTLPFASAMAIPILGAWIAEVRTITLIRSTNVLRRALPVAFAFLAATPVTYVLVGVPGLDALTYLSNGRIAPAKTAEPPEELVKDLTVAEKNCFDPASRALFKAVPRGLVLSPLFYGPTVLMLSGHDVVAGPYHRSGRAILDAIHATHWKPAEAKQIIDARGVDYVVACTISKEAAVAMRRAPDGLISNLVAGRVPDWLEPVAAPEETGLKLWRVVR